MVGRGGEPRLVEHYRVDGAICQPKPLQTNGSGRSHIPVWIAGGGERKTLRIAARYAEYTNFDGTPDIFRHKSQVLAEHCRDLGRDYGQIVRSANYNVVIGRNDAEVTDRLAMIADRSRPYLPGDRVGGEHRDAAQRSAGSARRSSSHRPFAAWSPTG